MSIRARAVSSAVALALLIPAAAFAQAPRNPYENLFGRPPVRTGNEYTAVHLLSTAGAQWGQTIQEDFLQPDAVIPEGMSGGLDATLTGEVVRDRVQLLGQGRYSYQEYRQTRSFGAPSFDTGARVNFDATTKLAFQAGGHFAHSPYFQLQWLAPDFTDTTTPAARSAILLMQNDTTEANAGITSKYTRRSSIEVSAFARRTEFALDPGSSFGARGARAMWHRQMSRDLGVHAGYGREELRQSGSGAASLFINERIDIGIDYTRSLSLGRRTSLSFATDTSMIRENRGTNHFRLNGHAEFIKRFERTWQVQLTAQRATEFLPGFRAPVFTERARASLGGLLAKQLMLNLNADAGQGQVGFNDGRRFVSYVGDATLTIALTRHFGFFTRYGYYRFQNPPDPDTVFFLPRVARQTVSFGIQTWVPLFDKEKVTRDPR